MDTAMDTDITDTTAMDTDPTTGIMDTDMDITDIMDMGMAAVGTTGTFMENKSFKTYEFKDTAIIPDRKLT